MDPELDSLIRTLDDEPHMAHLDITPSVERLSELGLPAAARVLPLLDAEDELTRLHAQRVLEGVVYRRFGFRPGRGFPSAQAEDEFRALWKANGAYDFEQDREGRLRAMALWREWIMAATD